MRRRVNGLLAFNTLDLILDAALDGRDLARVPLDQVRQHIEHGRFV